MLKFAILELLRRKPLTGYDIKKRFEKSLALCWHAEHSQIYPELKKLEEGGLVKSRQEIQTSRPNKRVFEITERGVEELRNWQETPPGPLKVKDELVLRLFAVDMMDAGDAVAVLVEARRLHKERLDAYREILERLERDYGHLPDSEYPSLFGPYICLWQGIKCEQAYVDWCDWAEREYGKWRQSGERAREAERVDLYASGA
ncbi:MAG: PadR family transcriptional regulator [Nitrospinota bacterium]